MTLWENDLGAFVCFPPWLCWVRVVSIGGAVVIWYHSSYPLKKELVQRPSDV